MNSRKIQNKQSSLQKHGCVHLNYFCSYTEIKECHLAVCIEGQNDVFMGKIRVLQLQGTRKD